MGQAEGQVLEVKHAMGIRVDAHQQSAGLRHPTAAVPQVKPRQLPVGLDKTAAVGQRLQHACGLEPTGMALAEQGDFIENRDNGIVGASSIAGWPWRATLPVAAAMC
ncbi:hypothetical protein [Cupriavidus sp. YR651]|uniref:hypothetical protein n=1 Tax=Cupriavidus sp. YR651 TaxID=1855315 RepID=UPI001C409ABE|nr:hypothetical protein [Cupriavidus sp. YR651]